MTQPPSDSTDLLQTSGDARGLARRITEAFMSARLDLSQRPGAPPPGWQGIPEVVAAGRLRDAGASEADVRLFITFTAAMDRARDADRLWYASERLFLEHRWAFQPEEITRRSPSELADALRPYGVSQRHSVALPGERLPSPSPRSPSIRCEWPYTGAGAMLASF